MQALPTADLIAAMQSCLNHGLEDMDHAKVSGGLGDAEVESVGPYKVLRRVALCATLLLLFSPNTTKQAGLGSIFKSYLPRLTSFQLICPY